MESRRNFVKAAFTFGTAVFASAKALAAQHTGHDKAAEHNMHVATDARHKTRFAQPVPVDSPDVPQLTWRMDGNVKEFNLFQDRLNKRWVPAKGPNQWGLMGRPPGPRFR